MRVSPRPVLVYLCAVLCFGIGSPQSLFGADSENGLWRDVEKHRAAAVEWQGAFKSYRLVQLDQALLKENFDKAPHESVLRADQSPIVIALPMPDGTFQRFSYVESPVMAPELAAQFPEIKTYLGQGIDDPNATVRFDWTPQGFHGFVRSPSGTAIIDPETRGQTELYVSYYWHDVKPEAAAWTCYTEDNEEAVRGLLDGYTTLSTGGQLLTYRIAVATTGEYTQFHGGTVALGLAAVTTAVNRISGIFEQEFCIRLQLVANNNLIIYTNAATDPYTGNNNSTMLDENQENLDNVIGSANYDIGHVFSTAGGGVTFPGIVCMSGWKGKGASGRGSPVGDAFAVEIAAHEMGHQVGSHHTWNGTNGNCSADQWGGDTAREPGSGSTIMAYAGLCGADDIQGSRDYYYHAISYEKIRNYCTNLTGANCPTISNTGNQAPTVNAGSDYTIPHQTPFVLTATGSDPDGHPITYCWEEMDYGPQAPLSAGDNGSSPIFRSWLPSTSPSRTFPRLSDLLDNTTVAGELLPTTARTLKMRCTVRDNRAGGGGVNSDDMNLTVTTSAGPFRVTYPNSAITWYGAGVVSWDVASTNLSPVNCSQVNIRLSVDGGLTYPYLLAGNTPNDGSAAVAMPNTSSNQARIKVEAARNVFFDVSDTNFSFVCPGSGVATNVSASDGDYSYVYVTWTLPAGALSHCEIWRNTTNNSGTATRIEDNWTTTGYQDASCIPYTTYYYWINTVNLCGGTSSFSASDSGWCKVGTPTNVVATDGEFTNMVRVTCDECPGATHYKLYRNTTNNTITAEAIGSWTTSRLWTDADAIPGQLYYYWVQAATSGTGQNPTDFSGYNTGWRGIMPPIVDASDGTSTDHVLVQWNTPTGANYYCVYRGVSSNVSQATALTGWITSTSYTDTTTVAGVPYHYWVKAAAAAGGVRQSAYGPDDVGWKAYQPPANVNATDGTDETRILITWNAVPLATFYRVYRSSTNDPGTATAQGTWQMETSYSDYTDYGVGFYYWVKAAAGSSGERPSGFSAGDLGWRALPPPTNLIASDGRHTEQVRITWTLSPGGSWYRVYRGTTTNPKLAGAIGDWSQNVTSYDDTTAAAGQDYYYWVKVAMDAAGTHASLVSNMDAGWRALTGPDATASDGLYVDRVLVSWFDPPGSPYYFRVYRNTKSNPASATPVSSWKTGSSFNDITATPGQVYYYWISASIDSSGTRASEFGRSNSGWRAKDCNNNGVPDQNDPDADGDGVPDDCDNCPNTVPGATVDANGCPPVIAPDFNRDGDVDPDDHLVFEFCASGPGIPYGGGCGKADFDGDNDVDQKDFSVFERCFSGENVPASVACAN
ncbi:MAG: reprolysin-like metallopeptidase [Phycisphaerae bacterium]